MQLRLGHRLSPPVRVNRRPAHVLLTVPPARRFLQHKMVPATPKAGLRAHTPGALMAVIPIGGGYVIGEARVAKTPAYLLTQFQLTSGCPGSARSRSKDVQGFHISLRSSAASPELIDVSLLHATCSLLGRRRPRRLATAAIAPPIRYHAGQYEHTIMMSVPPR